MPIVFQPVPFILCCPLPLFFSCSYVPCLSPHHLFITPSPPRHLSSLSLYSPPLPYPVFPVQSSIEQVQSQVEQLSREVAVLTNELMEKNNRMEELMEKNNRMEELLVKIARKHEIQCDTEESEMQ